MVQQVIEHEVSTTASPTEVFALLANGSTWPSWSPLGSFQLLEPGTGTPEGVGALRLFVTGRHQSRERVVTVRPDEEFSYTVEGDKRLRDYQAVISLTPGPQGTTIRWRSTFSTQPPLVGGFYRWVLGGFIGRTVRGLAQATSTNAAGDSVR
jgi:hypothetical protein